MKRVSRRTFLKGLAGVGLCALGGAAAWADWQRAGGEKPVEAELALPEHTREAMYYTGIEGGLDCASCHAPAEPSHTLYCHVPHQGRYVRCGLCPHRCVLAEGERGTCRVRENRGGKLYTFVYGNPCAVHVDPIEKKPFYHFLPGTAAFSLATAGCNLRCQYCQNYTISQQPPEETPNYDAPPEAVVTATAQSGAPSIAYTYSEPIVFYEYMLDTARLARRAGLRNVVISAGYINPEPLRELCRAVDAIKIDLKGYNDDFYRQVCGGTLEPVLEAIRVIHDMGVHLEIVNLVVPTLNDDLAELRALVEWVMDALGPGEMSSTNGGNPLSSAAALAAIKILEEERLPENAAKMGEFFKARFKYMQQRVPQLGDVRILGLMGGLEFVKDPETREPAPKLTRQIIYECFQRGLICIAPIGLYNNVIRVAPPLVITEEQANETLDIFEQALHAALAGLE